MPFFVPKEPDLKKILSFIPKGMGLPLLVLFIWNAIVYLGSRVISTPLYHYDMSLPIDDRIPLLPWTASIYLGCYVFWVVNYILATYGDREKAFRFVSGEILAKTVCLICFVAIPATLTRPEVTGQGFWDGVIRLIYGTDPPDNLFPSIHCLASWFCYIAVRGNKKIPAWYRGFSLVFAIAVCISTVTTKQHVFVDIPSGILVAELGYYLTEKIGFRRVFQNFFEKRTGISA